ncbi:nicotinate phosphoribosyltransferase [Spiroplasma culicicola]|uniref:nicotinate phosphoribosyltransferase n=1 Tax=Spiroplasma culicicola AES-1 TaxID=1276246 RepID=W6AHS1_9MOLU|nr:nicotinate phosphoribosyltransferase [Spiroplasma culicicola]AHI53234.1 nicotinate phosphoribosyltransferase [Spiroplasma culicicola AES-1]
MNKFSISQKIFDNYYAADYFKKTRTIINKFNPDQIVTMQWFQRNTDTVVCGIAVICEILKQSGVKTLSVEALEDGEIAQPNEPVLKITGKFIDFAHFEGLFDGILSRASTVATNAYKLKKAANQKLVLNMNDRMDYFLTQPIDGYASTIGGIDNLVTEASFEYLEITPDLQGTMPHALIASFNGDIIKAAYAYKECFPNNKLIVLTDYNNDCVTDSLKVAQEFKNELFAVRIDTSKALVDKSLQNQENIDNQLNGVNPQLIKLLRSKLDENGFNHVKIIVSSGFNEEKIKAFEAEETPVDIYGVGEALTRNKIGFTGDLVMVDGKPQSKVGRQNITSNRIKSIKYY